MFLRENHCSRVIDLDEIDSQKLSKRMKYRNKLFNELRKRFRKEYLGELVQRYNERPSRELRINEIVLIEDDNTKRLFWPLARMIELIPGRDRKIRTVRLKTQNGTVLRPVQRIFPLEIQSSETCVTEDKAVGEESGLVRTSDVKTSDVILKRFTSSGKCIKTTKRLYLFNYDCCEFETLPKSQGGGGSYECNTKVSYASVGATSHVSDELSQSEASNSGYDNELETLTPSMFLQELKECGVPDLDHLESISLQKRFLYRAKLREDLRKRFRLEYLGHLRQNTKTIRRSHGVTVGEVVLVENKNLKRLCWPLGKVTETFPGKDGIVRLAKVRTARGEILRPIQCLYSLEINAVSGDSLRQKVCRQTGTSAQNKKMDKTSRMTQPIQTTRRGRKVKAVQRLNL
ncbi:integrase catalytic domain-containing protein [Nephila pilipes]|uniref:Integrase catalytic domain-containing protein n=1 Tax=Nephila pilipes TaxID=299642 RepID=A0A8X6NR32_NEPPI|nr:integrase catalytic domain-containing protein [Nephila pilipes]